MANNVKFAISRYKKALLTATPIQNNLMDVYGLSTIIDENIFGDKDVRTMKESHKRYTAKRNRYLKEQISLEYVLTDN